MLLPDRRLGARAGVATACLLTLASCGPFDSPPQAAKVNVSTVDTNILFGAATTNAAAPSQTPAQELPPLDLGSGLTQPDNFFFNGNDFTFPTTPQQTCPAAPTTSFPAQPATTDVSSMPATGAYKWAGGGQYTTIIPAAPPITLNLPVPSFEQRVVRDAVAIQDPVPAPPGSPPDYAFTYQTIEPQVGSSNSLLLSWQVKASATQENPGSGLPSVADPEAGLVLKRVDALDGKGNVTSTIFNSGSGPGLLVFPLPVQPGATFSSTSVDTSTGANTLKISGTVGGDKENVDACGTWIQAWKVDATLTSGASSATPATLHFDVATQMGALIVAFNIDGPFFGTTYTKETARIGQTTADPIPAQYNK